MASQLLDRIARGRTDLARDFIEAGGSAAATDASGTPILQWCAYYGDVGSLRLLLAHGASLRTLGADSGLDAAAFHGHWQLCQFLLEQGAPVGGAATKSGETPLHASLCTRDRVRHDAVVKVLLAAHADPNAKTIPGVATGAFMRDCRTRGETPLHRAAAFGTPDTIRLLLDAGADREARDAHGDTPLAWGSWHARPAAVLRLLCHGDFAIHPRYRGMRANLVGEPLPDDAR